MRQENVIRSLWPSAGARRVGPRAIRDRIRCNPFFRLTVWSSYVIKIRSTDKEMFYLALRGQRYIVYDADEEEEEGSYRQAENRRSIYFPPFERLPSPWRVFRRKKPTNPHNVSSASNSISLNCYKGYRLQSLCNCEYVSIVFRTPTMAGWSDIGEGRREPTGGADFKRLATNGTSFFVSTRWG